MEVVFTTEGGAHIAWDGLLWSSAELAGLAEELNTLALPDGPRGTPVTDLAARLVRERAGPAVAELREGTGLPEEQGGLDGNAGRGDTARDDRTAETSFERGSVAAAEAHLCGGLCSDAGDAEDGDDDWDLADREWASLAAWAEAQQLIPPDEGPLRTGGREHDVRFDEASGRWFKYTKPGLAGYTVEWHEDGAPYMLNARPSQYLARLRRQNRLFLNDIRFEGVRRETAGLRIVTSQLDAAGRSAPFAEIRAGMEALGFVRLPWRGIGYDTAEAWRIGRMAVWDVHPANVVLAPGGVIVPIDVIITMLPLRYPPRHFHP